MSKVYGLLFLLFVSVSGFAQTSVDITATAGTIYPNLAITHSIVIATNDPVNGLITGSLGNIEDVVIPSFTSGNLANGGSFGSGGGFTINIPNYTISTFTSPYKVTFTSGTWIKTTLANGTIYYTMTAAFVDHSGNTGAFVMTTSNLGKTAWSSTTTATIQSFNLNLQLP